MELSGKILISLANGNRASIQVAVLAVAAVAALVVATICVPAARAQEFQPPYSGFSDAATAFPYGAALEGLGIVVSAGHGWEGDADGAFQRSEYEFEGCGTCEGIVEDLYTAELVSDHLIPLLRQAGARVYVVRQPDRNTAGAEVDDGDPGYSETGTWADGANVELGWGADYRTHSATFAGSASWNLDVPREGDYWVQARWSAGTNRCQTVRYTVRHAGGTAEFLVNQQADGSMWVHLGRLHFFPGQATVTVDVPGGGQCYLIADAVRLGGGVDSTSGRPWWEVGAYQWLGETAPASLAALNEVTIRPGFANLVGADFFISLHADAGADGTASGTSTYRYNCGTGVWWDTLDPATCDLPAGSADMQYSIQDRIVADVRAGWDPAWMDRGRLVGDYGELRPLNHIPGVLVETAFFDNLSTPDGMVMSDNQSLHDPRFRHIVARAIVRGLISSYAPGATFPADPPTHLMVKEYEGHLVASWRPPSGATAYRVYVAVDGRGYDSGRFTTSPRLVISDVPAGSVALVRVTALNAGGESSPSGAVAASQAADGSGPGVLVINAFDRLDSWVREDFNHRDYSFEHGMALAANGIGFDGAMDEAVVANDIWPDDYRMNDWIVGRESTATETFDAGAQAVVTGYVQGGGCVVASGTEIAWDLDFKGAADDRAFLSDVFGARYASDDAGSRSVSAETWPFDQIPDFNFDDGTAGIYDARYPDVFVPSWGSSALAYGTGGSAAIIAQGWSGRTLLMGFPFETVVGADVRASLMAAIVDYCGADVPVTADDPVTADEPDTADDPGVADDVVADDVVADDDILADDVLVAEWTDAGKWPDAGADVPLWDVFAGDAGADSVSRPDAGADRDAMTDGGPDSTWLADLPNGGGDDRDKTVTSGGCSTAGGTGKSSPLALILLMIPAVMVFVRTRAAGARRGS